VVDLIVISVLENIQVEICKILLKGDDRPTQVTGLRLYNVVGVQDGISERFFLDISMLCNLRLCY